MNKKTASDATETENSETTELQEAIKLALEAAEAANDAASEVSRLQSETSAAAARLDRFGARLRPMMIGLLVGAGVSIALGGLVYFKTLAEMRRTSATQIEALAIFQESVTELNGQLDAVAGLSERMAKLEGLSNENRDLVMAELTQMSEQMASQLGNYSDTAGNLQSQIATTLTERVDAGTQTTVEAMKAGISDLQLALSKMIAAAVTSTPPAANTASKPATTAKPTPKPRTTTTRKTTSKPAPKAEPNPFSYP
ncbi:hypothetical protein [Donghicola sp.]|jgi:uncharacterized phage infection (PIP) family protein YhgE|uniref:hypothetical protein n=1 Tax=Donghicola sp. TaxID=1929294 RepID=UPI0025CBD311|nr:hypothetical protein [Donghicola sp.]MCT4579065.1 hypothetical protein [Donghicola sp.]